MVHSGAGQGVEMEKLDRDRIEEYERDGFVVVRGLLQDRDLEPVRRVIAAHVDREAHQRRDAGAIADLHESVPFERRLYEIYRGSKRDAGLWNREVFSRELYDFGTNPAILDLAESILGPEIQFNGDYWVRSKLPHESLTTYPWHQDSGYYGAATEKHHILSLWIPLVDVDEVNGCLQMMPGSHRWGLLPTMGDGAGHLQPREEIEERGQYAAVTMAAGDVLAFHNLTFHRSTMNRSDSIRWSIDLRYSAIGVPLEWLFRDCINGFVARSRSDPGQVDSWEDWRNKRAAAIAAAQSRTSTEA